MSKDKPKTHRKLLLGGAGAVALVAAILAIVALSPNAQKRFAELTVELADAHEQLGRTRAKAAQATPDQRAPLLKTAKDLRKRIEALTSELDTVAEAAYAAGGNAAPGAGRHLVGLLTRRVARGNHEGADRLAKLLIDGQYPDPRIYGQAAINAYNRHNFDQAADWFGAASRFGPLSGDALAVARQVPKTKALWEAEQKLRAAEDKKGDLPRVRLKTDKGTVDLELFEDHAPNTVANFISLIEKGFYDGLSFHRVLHDFMAQGGRGPDGTPGYTIACECYRPDHRKHFRGSLAMALRGRDTGNSQFYIAYRPTPHLDGRHTVFGRVIAGMDVVQKLQGLNPHGPDGAKADRIIKATVLRKRNHPYEPKVIRPAEPKPAPKTPEGKNP